MQWEILPEGQLLTHAKEIVEQNTQATKATIDVRRLNTLARIRKEWGTDKAFYMKGSLGGRGKITDGSKECPDQFIVLVLQDTDHDGHLIEHAVAESPIAGPHALYVFRQDVNPELTWREVMSKSKAEARRLGARPVKHDGRLEGGQLVDFMSDRVATLLSATPQEFLHIEFNGKYLKLSRSLAIRAFESAFSSVK